jgi:hypothetical protein
MFGRRNIRENLTRIWSAPNAMARNFPLPGIEEDGVMAVMEGILTNLWRQ